jgi:hypothetical protein
MRAALALLAGCAGAWVLATAVPARGQAPHGTGTGRDTAPPAEAEEVIERAKGYRSWQRFPQYEKAPKLSKGHGEMHVVAWYNETAAPGVKGGSYPDGSVIVKENRKRPDAKPDALTVMAKRSGSWYWLKATPDWKVATADGKPVAGQEVASCVGCHNMAPREMVFSR